MKTFIDALQEQTKLVIGFMWISSSQQVHVEAKFGSWMHFLKPTLMNEVPDLECFQTGTARYQFLDGTWVQVAELASKKVL